MLEPEPTSVLQVSLGDPHLHTDPWSPPGLWQRIPRRESHSALDGTGLFPETLLGMHRPRAGFYGPVPEIAGQEEVWGGTDAVFPPARMNAAASSVAGLLLSPRRIEARPLGPSPRTLASAPNPTPERLSSPPRQPRLARSFFPTHHSNLYLPLLVQVFTAPPTPSCSCSKGPETPLFQE